MTRPTWPTDERFRRIAAKIADSVMLARAVGVPVSSVNLSCNCPLGCVPGANGTRPYLRSFELGLTQEEHAAFARGFDCGLFNAPQDPWYRLGAAYRERYP